MNDNSPAHHGTFTFRLAKLNDFRELRALYTDNPHHAVYIRKPEIVRDRIKKGLYQVVAGPDGTISSATASYRLPEKSNDFHEIGSTRSVRGFGLYEPLIAIQMMLAFFTEPPRRYVMADVQTSEGKVIEKLSGPVLQWQLFEPSQDLVRHFKATISETDSNVTREKVFLRCPVNVVPSVANYLLHLRDNPRIKNSGGHTLDIGLALPFLDKLQAVVDNRDLFKRPVEASWAAAHEEFAARAQHKPGRPISAENRPVLEQRL